MTKRKATRSARTRKPPVDYPLPRADDLTAWEAPKKDTQADDLWHLYWICGKKLEDGRQVLLKGGEVSLAAYRHHGSRSIDNPLWTKHHGAIKKELEKRGFHVQIHTAFVNTVEHVALLVSVPERE
jgi:hypothetical protein